MLITTSLQKTAGRSPLHHLVYCNVLVKGGKAPGEFMKQVFLLDSTGVDSISSLMEEWSEKNGVNNKTIIWLRLTMEEMLIRISKRFNGSKKGTLIIGKRFGKPYFKVRYRGESYDPTKANPGNEWANRMLGKIGLAPMWSYRDGMN